MSNPTYVSSTEHVQTWLDGTTLHIRFNNPAKHNALSVDMWEAVPPLLQLAREDDRVRLVVFSGAGEKAFVSGADISQFEDMRAAREAVTTQSGCGRRSIRDRRATHPRRPLRARRHAGACSGTDLGVAHPRRGAGRADTSGRRGGSGVASHPPPHGVVAER